MLRIAHLHDDRASYGLARYLAFLQSDAGLGALAEHRLVPVSRFAAGAARVEADVIVSHLPLSWHSLPGLMALRARHPGTTLVHVEHNHCEGLLAASTRRRGRLRTSLRSGLALFDHVVAVSQAQARWMRRHALVPTGQLSVIPPSSDLSALATLPGPVGPVRRIAAVGTLHRQKGYDILIQAFAAVTAPEARLDIFGDGPQRAELRALARHDPRVTLHGEVPAQAALRLADAIAIPSRWEPFGLIAQEAQVAGRKVLMSGRDGLSEQMGPGTVAVADLSVGAWSRALSDVLAAPAEAPRLPAELLHEATLQGWRALLERVALRQRGKATGFATI